MARYVFKLPDIGEGIAEAEIAAWRVAVGQRVEEDAPLADMMTDKATVELTSPVSGVVVELAGEAGSMVPVGAALVVLEVEGDGAHAADAGAAAPTPPAPERETPALAATPLWRCPPPTPHGQRSPGAAPPRFFPISGSR
ncbi:MAG: biotin/lipoyl-containing protein, partial [Sphingomonadaceae bacterium]